LNNSSSDAPGTVASKNPDSTVKYDEKEAVVHFIDARLGIAVAPRFTITPRMRYWTSNTDNSSDWYHRGRSGAGYVKDVGPDNKENESRRSLVRWELGFAASF